MASRNPTKHLARQLGLLKRSSSTPLRKAELSRNKLNKNEQIFGYLIVLDFESTCWKDKMDGFSPEIIEFPAVLVNLRTGEIEDKFHHYVLPTEHSKLSPFCVELTGIQQNTVDHGILVGVCLKLFMEWLHKHISEKQLFFPSISRPAGYHKAILVTWSDWDLNTCLQNECKRKGINYSPYLKSWIDLRKTYQTFYHRKPQGLNNALKDVGIKFEGREHSGIDDAINTAYLAVRMVKDGCILKATKSLILSTDICNRYESLPLMNQSDEVLCNKASSENHDIVHRGKRNVKSPLYEVNSNPSENKIINHEHPKSFSKHTNTENTENDSLQVNKMNAGDKKSLGIQKCKKHLGYTKITLALNKCTPIGLPKSSTSNKLTVTPPLCECGRRCKKKKVVNPGPNVGRVFYSCPLQRANACKYFQWECNVVKSHSLKKPNMVMPSVAPNLYVGGMDGGVNKQSELKKHYKNLFDIR